jgi:hypothetical protein
MKKTDNGQACGNCRFFLEETQAEDEIRWGYCRRYPPKAVANEEGETEGSFPLTVPENWCGEYFPGQ